jgi:TetR/AcrR family transcriptional repressor of nem operon
MDARERLIETTRDLLWERGYVGTSPRAILTRAGVGQGSMYHNFTGKAELAATALNRSAEAMKADAEEVFSEPGPVLERITSYLRRERDVLKGCRIGRMTEDPDVVANNTLRRPLADTLGWLQARLADLLAEGQADGEFRASFSPGAVAAAITAVVQGGYVLAKAAQSAEPFDDAMTGALELLSAHLRKP